MSAGPRRFSVDLDMVSAICPDCNILLVEASSPTFSNLGAAELTAGAARPVSIGNSYGGGESSSETSLDTYYDQPGIAITAATGDSGFGVEYPAASRDVIAVGGTTLSPASNSRGYTETAWSGAGSGCSAYEAQLPWQSTFVSGCTMRAVADVSAVADPNTGVAVYDTDGLSGWTVFGGTSVATQIISAMYAWGTGSTSTGAQQLTPRPRLSSRVGLLRRHLGQQRELQRRRPVHRRRRVGRADRVGAPDTATAF